MHSECFHLRYWINLFSIEGGVLQFRGFPFSFMTHSADTDELPGFFWCDSTMLVKVQDINTRINNEIISVDYNYI